MTSDNLAIPAFSVDEADILTVAEASRRILARELTASQLVEKYLARIAEVDCKVHTYIFVDADGARAAAEQADADLACGRWHGPLHGLPFAVKDNYDVAGMPATAASRLRLDHVPTRDADLVRQLKDAGAILIGKLSSWEYGTGNGGEYFDLPFETARNPWDTTRFPGGSSTGSGAAVAAGTAMFALGSDTTGSVRLPAAATGTVGVIPTPGLLSRSGILPNCYSMDIPGSLTWTVEDAAIVVEALAETAERADQRPLAFWRSSGASIAGKRLAVVDHPGPGLPAPDAAMKVAFEEAVYVCEQLGAKIFRTRLPVDPSQCFAMTALIGPAELASIHEEELRERPDEMGFALRDKLLSGSTVRAVDYIAAQRQRAKVSAAIDGFLRGYDAVLTYGSLHVSPRLGIEPEMTAFTKQTMLTPFNLSGHPALVQCIGFTDEGLPLHWQIIANRWDESTLFSVAHAYEMATPWRKRRPLLSAQS